MSFWNSIWFILLASLVLLFCKHDRHNQLLETKAYISTKNLIEAEELLQVKDEISGKVKKVAAVKEGRIPKSIHMHWSEVAGQKGTKKFKTYYSQLKGIYSKIDASKNNTVITYCHSGNRLHTTFVLNELLGYENIKNYI